LDYIFTLYNNNDDDDSNNENSSSICSSSSNTHTNTTITMPTTNTVDPSRPRPRTTTTTTAAAATQQQQQQPSLTSIEPTRNLVAYGTDLLRQQQQQAQFAPPATTTPSISSKKVDKVLIDFLQYYASIPQWVNVQQIKRGQDILVQYLPAIGATLYYRSLVPGFSLPKIAAVLLSTAHLAPPASSQQVQQRILDTGAFIAAISHFSKSKQQSSTATGTWNSSSCSTATTISLLEPYSDIWQAVLQVRVLHAKVRYALLNRQRQRSRSNSTSTRSNRPTTKEWDTKLYGIPINQEDMSVTLLAFSYNSLLGIEFILGAPLCKDDQLAYLHYWRYVGWLLGIETTENDLKYQSTLVTPITTSANSINGTSTTTTSSSSVFRYRPLDP
jgi:ER-bound oxygenase mpaB/B'/Rubber oxygenase, catalytic domain